MPELISDTYLEREEGIFVWLSFFFFFFLKVYLCDSFKKKLQ